MLGFCVGSTSLAFRSVVSADKKWVLRERNEFRLTRRFGVTDVVVVEIFADCYGGKG